MRECDSSKYMKSIGEIETSRSQQNDKKRARSERSELVAYFFGKVAPHWEKGKLTPRFFGTKLNHLKTNDLIYLKSVCESEEKRGIPFHKMFWGSLKIRK